MRIFCLVILISIFTFYSSNDIYAITAKANNRYGVRLGKNKKYKKAINEFNKAINKYDKSSAKTYHNKGWALESIGDDKKAIKSYKEAWRRAPNQIPSGEKLGFLYFKTKDYENAVIIGESVMKKNPENKEVPKWLPDAYLKRLQAREKKKKEEKKKEKKKKEKKKKEEKKKVKEEKKMIYATFDFLYRTGYYFGGKGGGFDPFIKDEGLIVNIPESLYIEFTPKDDMEFRMLLENPYLGGLMPNIITHNETFEGTYKVGKYMLGIGFTFNHYNSDINFSQNLSLSDIKIGFIFAYQKDKMKMRFSFYPRLIPHDGESSSDYTLDYDMLKMEYSYTVNSNLSYYSTVSARDYYIFDHTNKVSNYYGIYEIGLGMSIGNQNDKSKKIPLKFSIEFTEKFFLKNLNNSNPYGLLNGQGFFGIDKKGWKEGSPFSGFWALSQTVGIKAEEKINEMIFIYQKLILEIGDLGEDHHEFNLQLGIGAIY